MFEVLNFKIIFKKILCSFITVLNELNFYPALVLHRCCTLQIGTYVNQLYLCAHISHRYFNTLQIERINIHSIYFNNLTKRYYKTAFCIKA